MARSSSRVGRRARMGRRLATGKRDRNRPNSFSHGCAAKKPDSRLSCRDRIWLFSQRGRGSRRLPMDSRLTNDEGIAPPRTRAEPPRYDEPPLRRKSGGMSVIVIVLIVLAVIGLLSAAVI